jgi:hypothetical protein
MNEFVRSRGKENTEWYEISENGMGKRGAKKEDWIIDNGKWIMRGEVCWICPKSG